MRGIEGRIQTNAKTVAPSRGIQQHENQRTTGCKHVKPLTGGSIAPAGASKQHFSTRSGLASAKAVAIIAPAIIMGVAVVI